MQADRLYGSIYGMYITNYIIDDLCRLSYQFQLQILTDVDSAIANDNMKAYVKYIFDQADDLSDVENRLDLPMTNLLIDMYPNMSNEISEYFDNVSHYSFLQTIRVLGSIALDLFTPKSTNITKNLIASTNLIGATSVAAALLWHQILSEMLLYDGTDDISIVMDKSYLDIGVKLGDTTWILNGYTMIINSLRHGIIEYNNQISDDINNGFMLGFWHLVDQLRNVNKDGLWTGNTDCLLLLYGQLAGAYWGVENIEKNILELPYDIRCIVGNEIEKIYNKKDRDSDSPQEGYTYTS